jgi:cytochrome c oxidase subunit 2
MKFSFLPSAASNVADQTNSIFFALLCMSAFFLAIIFIPMIFILFKYRRTQKVDRTMPKLPHNLIEVTWMTIPLLMCLGFYVWASDVYFDEEKPPANAIEISVLGKQWMWKMEHAEGNSEIDDLHVPMGRPIKLTLASQDVIHSFFLPDFRIKQDVVPGRYTSEWFEAKKAGAYHIFCSQYCGADHAQMIGQLIVMKPADYEKWLESTSPGETLVQQGARRFRELGCSGCHMGSSIVHAPRLEGVFGKPVPLQDGQVVVADETYLRDCILTPALRVPGGYAPLMPSFQGHVSEDDLLSLIAYIKSLANVKVEGGMP